MLAQRPPVEELVQAGIHRDHRSCRTIAHAGHRLEKRIVGRRINDHLETQPAIGLLYSKGIIERHGGSATCASLVPRVKQLERRVAANHLAHRMDARPEPQELRAQNVLHTAVAPSLQGASRALSRKMSADAVNQMLYFRPDPADLASAGILPGRGLARLAPAAARLERAMARDAVKSALERRPTVQEMRKSGLFRSAAPALQAKRRSLARSLTGDQISIHLEDRRDPYELHERNVLRRKPHVAPAVHRKAEQLQRNLHRSSVEMSLKNRPSAADMVAAGLLEQHPEHFDAAAPARGRSAFDERTRFAIALKAAAQLRRTKYLDRRGHAALKELVLDSDMRVLAALEVFESDGDYEEMLDTLYRIANHAIGA